MPFTQEVIQLKKVEIHLMYFKSYNPSDYLDQLTDQEKERFFSFKHIKRKREFVATRILRHRLFGFEHIHYDEHGAPFIEKEGYISISHGPGVVGIAICKKFKIGLDIEPKRVLALSLQAKFLSEKEKSSFDILSEDEMTKVWSAKEVLYKLAGRKKILFKEQLLLEKRTNENWKGTILNPQETINVELHIFVHNELIISINKSACSYE